MTYREAADIIQKILDSRKTYFNEVLDAQISNFVLAGTDDVSEALEMARNALNENGDWPRGILGHRWGIRHLEKNDEKTNV